MSRRFRMLECLCLSACFLMGYSALLFAQSGSITASPNPCLIFTYLGQSICTSTISWSSQGTTEVQIWVTTTGEPAEKLFAAGGPGGPYNANAPWIQASPTSSVFSLYDYSSGSRGGLLGSVTVTGQAAPPCP